MSARLVGKTAVVTGAGAGIGRRVAERFAAEGATVVFTDRDEAAVTEAAAGVPGAVPIVMDIADEASVEAAFAEVSRLGLVVDVAVANAGIQLFGQDAPVADLDLEVWRRTIDVNLTGTFLTLKHAVRAMQQRGGSIIVTGSPTGLNGEGSQFTAYSSSKAGMHGMARAVAAAYRRRGSASTPSCPATPRRPWLRRSRPAPRTAPPSSPASRSAGPARPRTSRGSWSTSPATSRATPPAPSSAWTAA